MYIKNLLARISGLPQPKAAETKSYDDIFTGEANTPALAASGSRNFLLGLRPVQDDVDAYFKDVFPGPVF